MPKPTSIRIQDNLKPKVDDWLGKNQAITFTQLVNYAIEAYIAHPHTIA